MKSYLASKLKKVSNHHHDSYASQFETISGLSQWLTWLAIMLGVCLIIGIMYTLNQYFPKVDLVTCGIYFVIGSLAVTTLVQNFINASFLDHETKLATSQIKLLADQDDILTFLNKAEKSVFRTHIDSLYTIFLANPNINQDNLVEVLHSRLMARNRVAELFSSILITLGLIGTIVGLIQMMTGLQGVLNTVGEDTGSIAGGMMESLSGLGIAFYTTLIGAVCGGVILRILTSVVDANTMRYTAHLAELTEVNVLPFMRRMAVRLEQSGYYQRLDDPEEVS